MVFAADLDIGTKKPRRCHLLFPRLESVNVTDIILDCLVGVLLCNCTPKTISHRMLALVFHLLSHTLPSTAFSKPNRSKRVAINLCVPLTASLNGHTVT